MASKRQSAPAFGSEAEAPSFIVDTHGGGSTTSWRASGTAAKPTSSPPAFGSAAGEEGYVWDASKSASKSAMAGKEEKKPGILRRLFSRGSAGKEEDSSRAPVISGVLPGTFKHEGHIGLSEAGGFELNLADIPKVRRGGIDRRPTPRVGPISALCCAAGARLIAIPCVRFDAVPLSICRSGRRTSGSSA